MFNSLQDKLDKALQNISGRGKISEINVAETVKEIRRALVDADVNYKVAKDLTKRVQDKALGQNVLTSLTPGQLMTKIVGHAGVEQHVTGDQTCAAIGAFSAGVGIVSELIGLERTVEVGFPRAFGVRNT